MQFIVWPIALILGAIIAFLTVTLFVQDFYNVRRFNEALYWLLAFFIRGTRENSAIVIRGGEIANPESPVARIGGPGYAIILEDSAAVFERFGRISRVLGPGYYQLEPYERVRGVVDLRPYVHKVQARGFTKDGIPMQGEVEIEFQLRQMSKVRPEQSSQRSRRFRAFYTYTWEGVLNAVHNTPVREGSLVSSREIIREEVSYWFQRAIESHSFRELIASHPEASPGKKRGLVSRDALRVLEAELFNLLRHRLRRWGYQINRLQINTLDVSEEIKGRVRSKYFALWRALRLEDLKAKEARAELSALQIKSEVRVNTEIQFIEALAYEIAGLRSKKLNKQFILTVACINVLDNFLSSLQEESQFLIPSWILEQIDRLKRIFALPPSTEN